MTHHKIELVLFALCLSRVC